MAGRTRTLPVSLPPDAPAATPWFRTLQFSGFTVTVLMLIVGALVVLAPSLRILVEQQREIAALEARVIAQERAVEGLNSEIDRWSDPAFIESQARDRLLYVKPGDVSYLVIDDGATIETESLQPISDDIERTRVDWAQSLLASALTAALTDLPAAELVGPAAEVIP
jgi:cell division protein FtsB